MFESLCDNYQNTKYTYTLKRVKDELMANYPNGIVAYLTDLMSKEPTSVLTSILRERLSNLTSPIDSHYNIHDVMSVMIPLDKVIMIEPDTTKYQANDPMVELGELISKCGLEGALKIYRGIEVNYKDI